MQSNNQLTQKLTVYLNSFKKKLTWNDKKAKEFSDIVVGNFQRAITNGEVKPALNPLTIASKRRAGYSNPNSPLFATGDLSKSVKPGKITDDNATLEVVSKNTQSDSRLHYHTANKRAKGVPKRVPLSKSQLKNIMVTYMKTAVKRWLMS